MFREEGQPKANRTLAALLAMNRRRRYPSLSFIVPLRFSFGKDGSHGCRYAERQCPKDVFLTAV
jgi:hypothetical protein